MNPPRIVLAGAASGSGKTTAVCTILTLLQRRGVRVQACKCGPDYIDPMFHQAVLGVPSANLDPFFCNETLLRRLLFENAGEDLTVIEGVMGYYDGTGADGTDNSTYTVAARTDSPVILVLDGKGEAASLLAQLEGFLRFKADSRIRGVLFNRITAGTYTYLERQIRGRFGDAVIPVGFLPTFPKDYEIPSRHLGLVIAGEIENLQDRINAAADLCKDTIDLDRVRAIAQTGGELIAAAAEVPQLPPIRIAVAKDAAFCFYYKDTLRLLAKMGAALIPFSPLKNEPLPDGVSGLLLGGGYPELYAEQLEKNTTTRNSVFQAIRGGLPTIAECGGFQYLGRTLDGFQMCGALPHASTAAGKPVRFGYVTLTAKEDGLLGPAGTVLRGHEFHYWDSTDNGSSFFAEKPNGKCWDCVVSTPTLYAGYPHLFLPANPDAAAAFCRKCLNYKENCHDHQTARRD